VLGLMNARLKELGAAWADITVAEIYTVHDVHPLLKSGLLPAATHGTLGTMRVPYCHYRVRDGPAWMPARSSGSHVKSFGWAEIARFRRTPVEGEKRFSSWDNASTLPMIFVSAGF